MSLRRLFANLLLIVAIVCVSIWVYSYGSSAAYQFYEGRQFDQARSQIFAEKPSAHSHPRNAAPLRLDSTIGRISVPRLKLTALVSEGTDDETLQHAVGHIAGTALPGQAGNFAIAGHRDSFFRSLKNLEEHDKIVFTTLHGSYRYVVDQMEIVDPSNVSVLRASGGRTLTIVTCYPFHFIGPAPRRFVVRAHQVD